MAQSRVSAPGDNAIGSRAADLGAWDKLQLGWLDYEIVVPGQRRTLELGPHEYNTKKPQAAVVVLPDKPVTTDLGAPFAGSKQWYSGSGDDLERDHVALGHAPRRRGIPVLPGPLEHRGLRRRPVRLRVRRGDDGTGWKADRPATSPRRPRATASTATRRPGRPRTFDLSAYAGKTVGLRVRYSTDGAAQGQNPDVPSGIFVDDIVLTAGGNTLLQDGAETSPNGWTLDGFASVGCEDRHGLLPAVLHREQPRVRVASTSTSRPARTTSGSSTSPTWRSTSPTRTACSSRSGTPPRATTTRASTRVRD